MLLTDTAGLRHTGDRAEGIGVAYAASLIEAADILLWLGAPEDAPLHPRLVRVHPKAVFPDRSVAPTVRSPFLPVPGEA